MFFSHTKRQLGVDIGTTGIKVAQLRKEDSGYLLETYGVVNINHPIGAKEGSDAIKETAEILQELLAKSQVSVTRAVASLPNSIVFVSVIEMPEMSDKELSKAIEWEARRYIPLPLSEVTLSSTAVRSSAPAETGQGKKMKVLLTAAPTSVIENYDRMFKLAGLETAALEIEVLGLIRSLLGSTDKNIIIIDIGGRSSSVNLVEQGFLQVSRHLPIGGESITEAIAKGLNVDYARADQFKRDMGVKSESGIQIPESMNAVLEGIKHEARQLMQIYETKGGKIQEIVMAGGGALLPGLTEYFADLGVKVTLGDPLRFVSYQESKAEHLRRNALSLSISLGLAMRNL